MDLIEKFKEYLLSNKKKPSKVTTKNYLSDVRKFITWFENYYNKQFKPQQVTSQTISEYKQTASSSSVSEKSLQRYLSSLRKFFQFLKNENIINYNPFESVNLPSNRQREVDPWSLNEFKSYLQAQKASELTIKNYILDIKQFLNWVSQVIDIPDSTAKMDKRLLPHINTLTLEEYKQRLQNEARMSPVSINRKLSSIRKYFNWAQERNYLEQTIAITPLSTTTTQSKVLTPINDTKNIKHHLTLENLINLPEEDPSQIQPVTNYSSLGPIRLFQRLTKAINVIFDLLIIIPVSKIIETTGYKIWELKGKEIFQPIEKIATLNNLNKDQQNNLNQTQKSFSTIDQPFDKPILNISKEVKPLRIHNIPKSVYAPLNISLKGIPLHKKILHHLKHTRPQWYKKYRSYPLSNYFQLAILAIFITAISFSIYRAFFINPKHQNALAALPTAPPRILSFQGRLTDASNNPLTAERPLRFAIYNSSTSSGSALLWQEVQTITPDQDGIFSVLLGSNTSIPATLFSQNASLYLGITVGTDTELNPRQQLATVAYAANAETLQGLQPITQSGAGTSNVVLALDSAGNLTIGGSATPTFQVSGGKFTLSGQTLALNTNAGSNTNVQIAPDGLGTIDLQKPLQNTSNNNNISSAKGSVEIDDIAAILASSSGQSAFTINQTGTGPLISASTSGVAKFTVDNNGGGTFAGDIAVNGSNLTTNSTTFNLLNTGAINLNIGGAATAVSIGANSGNTTINNTLLANNGLTVASGKSLIVSGNVASNLIPSANNTYDLGSSTNYWNNLYVNNIVANSGATVNGFWQRNNGVVAPSNITDDLSVGGNATSSAKFQVFANTGNATTSGNLTFTGTGSQLQTVKNQTLTLGGNSTGDIQFKPGNSSSSLYLASNGFAGIGTTTPTTNLDVENGTNTGTYAFQVKQNNSSSYGAYIFVNHNSSTIDALNVQGWNGSSTVNGLDVKGNGYVGIGTTSPTDPLTVAGNQTISGGELSIRGAAGTNTSDILIQHTGTTSSSNIQYALSNRSNNTDFWIYGYDGTNFWDPFKLLWNGGSGNQILSLASDGGSVGIGTTSPLAASGLTISKNSLGNALVNLNNLGTSGDLLTASSAGTTKFRLTNSGDVIIPDSGHIYFTQGNTTPTGNNFALYSSAGGGETVLNAPNTSSIITFKLGNLEQMRLNSTGFGIGTTNPQSPLDITSNASTNNGLRVYDPSRTEYMSLSYDGVHVILGSSGQSTILDCSSGCFTNGGIAEFDRPIQVDNPNGETTAPTRSGNGQFAFADVGGVFRLYFQSNGTNRFISSSGAGDYSEYFLKNNQTDSFPTGSIISLDNGNAEKATKSASPIGVVSAFGTKGFDTNDGERYKDPKYVNIGLLGHLPVIVSSENGAINPGDLISNESQYPGVGTRNSNSPKQVIGRAIQAFNPNNNICPAVSSLESIKWPEDLENDNQDNICFKLPTGIYVGRIMTYVSTSWSDPSVQLTNAGDLNIATNSSGFAVVTDKAGNPISQIATFAQAVIANIRAGIIQTQKLTTDTLAVTTENITIGGQTLRNYIASIVEDVLNQKLKNNLANNPARSNPDLTSPLSSNSANLEPTPSILAAANASLSGTLNSKNLQTQDATISGTLHVKNLIADNIAAATVSATYITNVTNIYSSTPSAHLTDNQAPASASATPTPTQNAELAASSSADINPSDTPSTNIPLNTNYSDISSMAGLLSYAPDLSKPGSSLSDLSVAGQLSVGGNMILADNSINTLGADLQIQSLRQGNIQFEGGLIAIDTDGNLTVGGNANFAKDVTIKGTLAANLIAPVPDKDLIFKLGSPSPIPGHAIAKGPELKVQNASGSSVFDLDQLGNVIASGSGRFAQLAANALNIVKGAQADTSLTETIATSSAGTAVVTSHETQRTIFSPFVHKDSLIYLTATSDTQGVTPYVARQTEENPSKNSKGSFTIEIPYPVTKDIHINWWIVN